MLVNFYYGGPSTHVEQARIHGKRGRITVTYEGEEMAIDSADGNLRRFQDQWITDAAVRKNGLHRVTIEDATAEYPIKWDTDLVLATSTFDVRKDPVLES